MYFTFIVYQKIDKKDYYWYICSLFYYTNSTRYYFKTLLNHIFFQQINYAPAYHPVVQQIPPSFYNLSPHHQLQHQGQRSSLPGGGFISSSGHTYSVYPTGSASTATIQQQQQQPLEPFNLVHPPSSIPVANLLQYTSNAGQSPQHLPPRSPRLVAGMNQVFEFGSSCMQQQQQPLPNSNRDYYSIQQQENLPAQMRSDYV